MKAVVQRSYGSSEVLEVAEIDRPEPAAGEVLVEVRAAGLDRGTWHLMAGLPYIVRPAFGLRAPRNPVVGTDVSGVVAAVGAEVSRFEVGDEVFGIAKGSFAEYAIALEKKLVAKPANVSFEQAAVVAVSGLTALQALTDVGQASAGEKVLIVGASGGVGTYAVQIAKASGAHVTGVASAAKVDLVRSLGADRVIDYRTEDFADGSCRYDLIVDIGGNTPLAKLRAILERNGTLVIVGGEQGSRLEGGVNRQLRAKLWSPFVPQTLTFFISSENQRDLERLAAMVETGEVVPSIDAVYPLEDAPRAMTRLEAGEVRGKVAIAVGGRA